MSIEVFARTSRSGGVADRVQAIVDEFMGVWRDEEQLAGTLAGGPECFADWFPQVIVREAGVAGLRAHVDLDQITRRSWEELVRRWGIVQGRVANERRLAGLDATAPTPEDAVEQGGALRVGEWEKSREKLDFENIDDWEIDSASSDEEHAKQFEGSARYRKGRWNELGIRPNSFTGEIGLEIPPDENPNEPSRAKVYDAEPEIE